MEAAVGSCLNILGYSFSCEVVVASPVAVDASEVLLEDFLVDSIDLQTSVVEVGCSFAESSAAAAAVVDTFLGYSVVEET